MGETKSFNGRLQPTQFTTLKSGTNLLVLGLGYGTTNNSGNVVSQSMAIPGQSWSQSYGYDGVNRLSSVSETGGTGWSQNFSYDNLGNRWVSGYTNLVPQAQTPLTSSWYSAATNRMVSASYDNAGNQLTLGAVTMSYDAESRMTQAVKSGTGISWTTQYRYDGEGRRVKKVDANNVTTVYVYDVFGQLASEHASTVPSGSVQTQYLSADHLGSTRLTTDASWVVLARRDYQPFGEEIGAGVSGRAAIFDTYSDVNQRFTGKERDAETGLDYFGARYLASVQGRFVSPDWSASPAPVPYGDFSDPQTLNLFSYARNNPLSLVDPDGHCPWCIAGAVIGGLAGAGVSIITQEIFDPKKISIGRLLRLPPLGESSRAVPSGWRLHPQP